MNWIYDIPLWVIILFAVSLTLNVALLCIHFSMRRMRNEVNKLSRDSLGQVNDYRKIADNSMEIVRIEHERVVKILDWLLTEEQRKELEGKDDSGD